MGQGQAAREGLVQGQSWRRRHHPSVASGRSDRGQRGALHQADADDRQAEDGARQHAVGADRRDVVLGSAAVADQEQAPAWRPAAVPRTTRPAPPSGQGQGLRIDQPDEAAAPGPRADRHRRFLLARRAPSGRDQDRGAARRTRPLTDPAAHPRPAVRSRRGARAPVPATTITTTSTRCATRWRHGPATSSGFSRQRVSRCFAKPQKRNLQ